MDHNPYLKPWREPRANPSAGKGVLEEPGAVENIAWQTRAEPPSQYESELADALMACFESGVEALPDLVCALNERGVLAPDGSTWSEDSFQQEMQRLGR